MDSVMAKFYGTSNNETSRFNQFGALSSSKFTPSKPMNQTSSFKIQPIVPIPPSTFNKTTINPNQIPITNNTLPKYNNIQLDAAPTLKPVVFNSTSDMIRPPQVHYKGELYQLKQKRLEDEKRNATKLQIMEEKMRNLELKSQRLEVINDFFFDMFENNLVKEHLQKQREDKAMKELEDNEENDEYDEYDNYNNMIPQRNNKIINQRKKRLKSMSANQRGKNVNLNNFDYREPEFDPEEFQEKTIDNARKILKGIKENIGNYMLEEQLKKNEELQTITEEIVEMKNELHSRIQRLAQRQKNQMETLAFCLQNSGNPQIEDVANRILTNEYYNYQINAPIFGSPNSNDNPSSSSKRGSKVSSKKNPLVRDNHRGARLSILKSNPFGKRDNIIKEVDEKSSSSSSSSSSLSNTNTNNVNSNFRKNYPSGNLSKKTPGRKISYEDGH